MSGRLAFDTLIFQLPRVSTRGRKRFHNKFSGLQSNIFQALRLGRSIEDTELELGAPGKRSATPELTSIEKLPY